MAGIAYKICFYCNRRYDSSKEHTCKQKYEHDRKVKADYQKKVKAISAPLRTKRWHDLRTRIILADGGYCQRCFAKYGIYTYDFLEVHHIKPRINNPELIFDENNLVTLCHSCNAQLALNELDFGFDPAKRAVNHDYHI